MLKLFREQAASAQRGRLQGQVLLYRPLAYTTLTFILVGILLAAMAFLAFGAFPRTEKAVGYLKPSKGVISVHTRASGVITRLQVAVGEIVEAGEVLAVVTAETPNVSGLTPEANAIHVLGRRITELESVISELPANFGRQESRLNAELGHLAQQITQLDEQLRLQQSLVESTTRMFELTANSSAAVLSKTEHEQRRRSMLLAQREKAQLSERLSSSKARKTVLEAQLTELPFDRKRRSAELDFEVSELRQRRIEWKAKQSHLIIAPVAGTITDVNASLGAQVDLSQSLLSMVPSESELQAEIFVASQAIGFVGAGQEVKLNYSAFPREHFGTYRGKVQTVGGTILAPHEVDLPIKLSEPAYRVVVRLESEVVESNGMRYPLKPGTLLEANLVLENRSLLDWLISPFTGGKKYGDAS